MVEPADGMYRAFPYRPFSLKNCAELDTLLSPVKVAEGQVIGAGRPQSDVPLLYDAPTVDAGALESKLYRPIIPDPYVGIVDGSTVDVNPPVELFVTKNVEDF